MRDKFKFFCFITGLITVFPCFPLGLLLLGAFMIMTYNDNMEAHYEAQAILNDKTLLKKDDPA